MAEKLAAGIDLQDEMTQISFLRDGMKEPESIRMALNENRYLIPTVLAKSGDSFLIGEDALKEHKTTGCPIADRLLTRLIAKEENVLGSYGAQEALGIFLDKLLHFIPDLSDGIQQIKKIVFSIEKDNRILIDGIFECMEKLGIQREHLFLMTQADCSAFYALSQERGLWQNEVFVFDFSQKGFCCRKMKVERVSQNQIPEFRVCLEENWYTDRLRMEMLDTQEGRGNADDALLRLVEEIFEKRLISCVYLVGDGFYREGWMEKSLPVICQHRRVFMGRNLYTKGACYAAWDKIDRQSFRHYRFECPGRVPADVGIRVIQKGEETILWLAKAGSRWYEVNAEIEGILDDENFIALVIRSPMTGELTEETMSCESFPLQKRRMNRIHVTLRFSGPSKACVRLKDLGFGEFMQGSDRVISKEYLL